MKCMEKKDKYSARERTGPNVVKLENVCILFYVDIIKILFLIYIYTNVFIIKNVTK